MTPQLSIVTASQGNTERFDFLTELAHRIQEFATTPQWIVASSGDIETVKSIVSGIGTVVPVPEKSTASHSRNAALKKATGKFVMNIDDDDLPVIAGVENLMDVMLDAGAKFGAGISADYYPHGLEKWGPQLETGVYLGGASLLARITDSPAPVRIHPSAMCIDRETLTDMGGWDTSLKQAEDIDLALRAAAHTDATWAQTSLLVHMYRKWDGQMMNREDVKSIDGEIINTLYEKFGLPAYQN